MKSLVLAEKPSVARDIARVLGCRRNISGAIEGNHYIVTWALGHLVTLADPEEYDSQYKDWSLSALPMIPKRWELVVIRQSAKQYHNVKAQLSRKDVDQIIIATDAGREGELVARWILDKSGCKKPIKRLWISSVTDKAIREGFACLKDGRMYDNLYRAAKSRAEADWLVGINATRALTCKYNAQLSCGRVQTPTLAIIAAREDEIRSFKPEDYYGLTLNAGGVVWTWRHKKSGSLCSFHKDFVENIRASLKNQTLTVTEAAKSAKKVFSPGLYDLTELQRDANQRFGFSAKETLNIMQRLYENHKVLTYPRTDSRYIGTDIVPTIKERLRACNIGPYRQFIPALLKNPIKAGKSFVDDKKVSDHHAIIPTEEFVQLEHMTNEERKIYDLVVRRFISVLYPAFEYEQTTLKAEAAGEIFTAKGKVVKAAGWRAVYAGDSGWDTDDTYTGDSGWDTDDAFTGDSGWDSDDAFTGDSGWDSDDAFTDDSAEASHSIYADGGFFASHGQSGHGSGTFRQAGQSGHSSGTFRQAGQSGHSSGTFRQAGQSGHGPGTLRQADQSLPPIKRGTTLAISHTAITTGKTKPPARFTEATLLSAMENPARFMESKDAKARKTLGETGGLGTVATRADIIEKLFHSFLIEKKGQDILLTSKGRQLLSLVPEDLKKPELTARWEMELSDIAKGSRRDAAFIKEIQGYTRELIDEIKSADGAFRHDNLTNTRCPRCGKRMLSVKGKNARLLVCQDRECGYRETIARQSNARCPNCHKKMELIKKGAEETFVCACGYKEKLSAFKARREREGAGVTKKDVQRYLKQQKEESVNNGFAAALSGIKLD